MSQPQVFWSTAWEHFYVWDRCHCTFLFLPVSSFPHPKTGYFWRWELLYFTSLCIYLYGLVFSIYTTPYIHCTYIYSTHLNSGICRQAAKQLETNTLTHTIPATRHIFVNTSIRQRLLSFFYPIPVLEGHLSYSENLQYRLPSFRCFLGGQGGDCIIYDASDRHQKDTRTAPRIRAKQSNTVPALLGILHDSSFHFEHKTLHPSLLRASERAKIRGLRIWSPKGAWRYIFPLRMLVLKAPQLICQKKGRSERGSWQNISLDEERHIYLHPSSWRKHHFPKRQNIPSPLKQRGCSCIQTDLINFYYNANSTCPLSPTAESSLFVRIYVNLRIQGVAAK